MPNEIGQPGIGETTNNINSLTGEEFLGDKHDAFFSGTLNDDAGEGEPFPQTVGELDEYEAGALPAAAPQTVEGENQEGAEPSAEEQAAQAVAVLKYYGQEIPVKEMNELVALAQKGLDYTEKTQAIGQYKRLIQTVQNDPQLMELVNARMQGRPLPQQPQQPTPPEAPVNDMEQKDDETWDQYVQRLAKITAAQTVQEQLEIAQRQRVEHAVVSEVVRDPDFKIVMDGIVHWGENGDIPPAIYERAKTDIETFKWLYGHAKNYLYNLASRQNSPAPQQVAAAQQPPVKPQQTRPKPPVLENASGANKSDKLSRAKDTIWKDMDDSEFDKYVERVKARR